MTPVHTPAPPLGVVALYCRLSPRPDGQYEGVEDQERQGREYSARTWPGAPVEVFADAGVTAAKDGVRRPEYERLNAAIEGGRVAHVWTVEQTRISRSLEWFAFADLCDAAGIAELHTRRDGVVRLDSIAADFNAVNSRREVRRLTARTRDALAERAAAGRPHGGETFGYRRGRDGEGRATQVQVPEEAEAVRWAAEAVLSGWSLGAVGRELRARGLRGRHGASFGPTSVRSLLLAPTIAGLRTHHGTLRPGTWEPIIPAQTWYAVRARLTGGPRSVQTATGGERQAGAVQRRAGRRYWLTSGLAVCGPCGSALTGTLHHQRRGAEATPRLLCQKARGGCGGVSIALDPVEEHVRDALFAELDRPEFLAALAADDHSDRRDELLADVETVAARRAELGALWAGGAIDAAGWTAARATLDERERAAQAALRALPAPALDIDALAGMRAAWPGMTLDERREFVRLFIEQVIVLPAELGARRVDVERRVRIAWRAAN